MRRFTLLAILVVGLFGCDDHSAWNGSRQENCNEFAYAKAHATPAFEAAALLLESEGTDQERCRKAALQLRRAYVLLRHASWRQEGLAKAGDRPKAARLGSGIDFQEYDRLKVRLAECQQAETNADGRPAGPKYQPSPKWQADIRAAGAEALVAVDRNLAICEQIDGMKWTDAESNPEFIEALNHPRPLPAAVDPETVKKAVAPACDDRHGLPFGGDGTDQAEVAEVVKAVEAYLAARQPADKPESLSVRFDDSEATPGASPEAPHVAYRMRRGDDVLFERLDVRRANADAPWQVKATVWTCLSGPAK